MSFHFMLFFYCIGIVQTLRFMYRITAIAKLFPLAQKFKATNRTKQWTFLLCRIARPLQGSNECGMSR